MLTALLVITALLLGFIAFELYSISNDLATGINVIANSLNRIEAYQDDHTPSTFLEEHEHEETEEERKHREEKKERQRAWTKEQIEKAWGGWRKATLVCCRYDPEKFEHEYILLTPDRTYTVRLNTFWTEWEGKPGTEAEYATHPNLRFLYIRKPDGGFVQFDILEEKLRKSATHAPGVLFD
ncbi:MAG: hypothetical protein LAP13_09290 [Acidobacteriia bacterium]|nr:hypothetical protein [Terriglobia bacterium]